MSAARAAPLPHHFPVFLLDERRRVRACARCGATHTRSCERLLPLRTHTRTPFLPCHSLTQSDAARPQAPPPRRPRVGPPARPGGLLRGPGVAAAGECVYGGSREEPSLWRARDGEWGAVAAGSGAEKEKASARAFRSLSNLSRPSSLLLFSDGHPDLSPPFSRPSNAMRPPWPPGPTRPVSKPPPAWPRPACSSPTRPAPRPRRATWSRRA